MLFCNAELFKPALTNEVSRIKIRGTGNGSGGREDNSNTSTVIFLWSTFYDLAS